VLVNGVPLSQATTRGERCVEAVLGAPYELRLLNPLRERVAVAVSVDGLNVVDARHTGPWDASKWVIHPHDTLTLSGWQVGSERARRFYFTTERDAYATRIGRPAEFGVITAVFYRERRPPHEIVPPRLSERERVDLLDAREAERKRSESVAEAADDSASLAARSAHDSAAGGDHSHRGKRWRDGRAATGIGASVRSEVQAIHMELDPHPAGVVTLRYDFRPTPSRPIPSHGFAPEPPHWRERDARRHDRHFSPEQ
jgi:hypothetical protein